MKDDAAASLAGVGFPIVGDTLAFTTSDSGVKVGAVTNNGNGTYTATLTSSQTPHQLTVTATDSTVSPSIAGLATLTQTQTATTPPTPPPTTPQTPPTTPPKPPTKPSNSTLPVIAGSATVGHTLSASTGTWAGTPKISYAYQWQRCKPGCANIAGATRSSYTLAVADKGAKLQVVVAATNGGGAGKAVSRQVGPVGAPLSASQMKALLMKVLIPSGKAARIRALLQHGGYGFSFSSPGTAHLAISWYLPASGARGAKGKRLVLVAAVSASFQGARTRNLKVVLTPKGKKALKGVKHLKLSAQGALSATAEPSISATRQFTVKR